MCLSRNLRAAGMAGMAAGVILWKIWPPTGGPPLVPLDKLPSTPYIPFPSFGDAMWVASAFAGRHGLANGTGHRLIDTPIRERAMTARDEPEKKGQDQPPRKQQEAASQPPPRECPKQV